MPNLGKTRLNDLGVEAQQIFVNRLSGTVSRKMLLNVLGTLSSMLKTAQNWGYLCDSLPPIRYAPFWQRHKAHIA